MWYIIDCSLFAIPAKGLHFTFMSGRNTKLQTKALQTQTSWAWRCDLFQMLIPPLSHLVLIQAILPITTANSFTEFRGYLELTTSSKDKHYSLWVCVSGNRHKRSAEPRMKPCPWAKDYKFGMRSKGTWNRQSIKWNICQVRPRAKYSWLCSAVLPY